MDPFGTGQTLPPLQLPQTAVPSATGIPLKKPPKWIRRPVGASFAVSPVSLLFMTFSIDSVLTYQRKHIHSFGFSSLHSLVGSWCLWRTQSRTHSSPSSPLHTLYISAKLLQKQPFWSAPSSCRPLWVQAALWTSARKRSVPLKTSLKRLSGLFSRYDI